MKILFVNSVCGVGSTGRIVTDLADSASENGHSCYIAFGLGEAKRAERHETLKISSRAGYITSNIISKVSGVTGSCNYFATRKLIRFIEEIRPDIIHLHNLHGYYLNIFMLFRYLTKRNIPVILTLHDCFLYTGECSCYSFAGCEKWKDHCAHCPQLKQYPQSLFFDFSHYQFTKKNALLCSAPIKAITTPSVWLKKEVEQSFLGKFPCEAIYNGMDVDQFSIIKSTFKEKYNLLDKKIVLGVANAWGKKKGLPDFIKLSELLPENYQVVLVGLSTEQLPALPKSIYGIQRTESIERLVEIYNSAEVFVNPSYEETFGMVTAEALLCGVPVVTYDKTAVPEIADAPFGVAVEAGDIEALVREIVHMKAFDRQDIRRSALKYSKKAMADNYMKLYESVYAKQANGERL